MFLNIRRRAGHSGISIFNFHQVHRGFDPRRHCRRMATGVSGFERFIRHLLEYRRIIPLSAATGLIDAKQVPAEPTSCITFDDGDRELLETALPFLAARRVPATLFINSAAMLEQWECWVTIGSRAEAEKPASWNREMAQAWAALRHCEDAGFYAVWRGRIEALAPELPSPFRMFLSHEELARLDPTLFHVGLHGHEHQRFRLMSPEWQATDLDANVAAVKDLPGYTPVFAVPFGRPGDWDQRTVELCDERGLRMVLADGGVNYGGEKLIARIPADGVSFRRVLWRIWRD